MGDLSKLVDGLYSQFVLRDFAAKILPGSLVLFTGAASIAGPDEVWTLLQEARTLTWLVLMGWAWIVAIALQAVFDGTLWAGRADGKILVYRPKDAESEWADTNAEFDRSATPEQQRRHERLVVVKEVAGNVAVAVAVAAVVAAAAWGLHLTPLAGTPWRALPAGLVVAVMTIGLFRLNRRHAQAQWDYVRSAASGTPTVIAERDGTAQTLEARASAEQPPSVPSRRATSAAKIEKD